MKNPWIGVVSRDYNGNKIIVAEDDSLSKENLIHQKETLNTL